MAELFTLGDLDDRIELKRGVLTDDGMGGSTEVVSTYATVWAHVKPMTGDERQAAQRTEASANYLVIVRNRDDVREGDVIAWRGRALNVRFVMNRGPRAAWLEIECEMGVAV